MYVIHSQDSIHSICLTKAAVLREFVLYCNKKAEQIGYHLTVITHPKSLLPADIITSDL